MSGVACDNCGNPETQLTNPDYGRGSEFTCYRCNVYGHRFVSSSPEAQAISNAARARSKAAAAAYVARREQQTDPEPKGNSMPKPSIGRIVHYTNLGDRDGKFPPTVQGAMITGLNEDGTVALHVFYRTGQFDLQNVAQTEAEAGSEGARGKWCWPKRDE